MSRGCVVVECGCVGETTSELRQWTVMGDWVKDEKGNARDLDEASMCLDNL